MKPLPALLLLCVAFLSASHAGTNGSVEGTVRDGKTGEPLPGVNVQVVELRTGTSTDTLGGYRLANIRSGVYSLRFTHIGYTPRLVKGVLVDPDRRMVVNAALQPSDIHLDEVVVVQDKPLIRQDVTGTTYFLRGEEIKLLPIGSITDVLGLQPGVTLEGNVRGGKTTDVVYLVDGLPVQDFMAGGVASVLPASSVFGMSVYTGGFEPEYGNALAGVVNIVTRTGGDEQRIYVRGNRDRFGSYTQTDRASDVEASASGPIRPGKIYYTVAGRGLLSDTRWWQDMQLFFPGSIDRTWSAFAKVDYLTTPAFRVALQFLYTDHRWRDYEFPWRYDLEGLPPERKTTNRAAIIVSHTLSDRFFYTASLSRYYSGNAIGDGSAADVPGGVPWQYDFFLRYIVQGQRAWWVRSSQESYTGKFDGTLMLLEGHLLKLGGEGTLYDLNSDVVRFEPQMTFFGKPIASAPMLDFSSSYRYFPRAGALYVQDKIDVVKGSGVLNIGLRFDLLDTRATRPAVGIAPTDSGGAAYAAAVSGGVKHSISPRVGASFPVDEASSFFINFGWYTQFPLFDELYTGLDRVALERGVPAILGNPGLEPERSAMAELSYKRSFPHGFVASIAYFRKSITNLIDTRTFVPGFSHLSGSYGFAQFVNDPYANVEGLEISVARGAGSWLTGELSYTYMVAEGTSGSADQGFAAAEYGLPVAPQAFPLAWDQRHALTAVLNVEMPSRTDIHLVAHLHSGRPYTYYPWSTGFEPVSVGLFAINNQRMPGFSTVDILLEQHLPLGFWRASDVSFYLDVRNLFNTQNVAWMDANGQVGGELQDPSGYYIGRRTRVGIRAAF
ncbi:MAG TPA: TonB-dependent receptor [Bacteroidota bacterium]|nr:TonB-dependent receptor [Bacteroidota bacterium]